MTEQEEKDVLQMLNAYKNGKRFDQLDIASGALNEMWVPVRDKSGETRRLNVREAVDSAGNAIAGRIWDLTQSSSRAVGVYGHPDAIINMDRYFGLGRYLVTNDRTRRKLDPKNSNKYSDGSPAKLDGTEGHCMFGFDMHYQTIWVEGNYLIKAMSKAPIAGKGSVLMYEGGHSWINGSTLDKATNTLCAYITDDPNYIGGAGAALPVTSYNAPEGSPQQTMLYMPRTGLSTINYSTYARKLGEGWEACWHVHRFAIENMLEIYFGTRNIREAYNALPDANGLPQGGLGQGCTAWDYNVWTTYNGNRPVIPTNFAVDNGDFTGTIPFNVTHKDGSILHTANVPVFFGLVNPCYGDIWQWVSGMILNIGAEKSEAYVARNLYDSFDFTSVANHVKACEMPRATGYIKRRSHNLMCGMATEIGGSTSTYDAVYHWENSATSQGIRVRLAGGRFGYPTYSGAGASYTHNAATYTTTDASSPLCYSKGNQTPFPIDE